MRFSFDFRCGLPGNAGLIKHVAPLLCGVACARPDYIETRAACGLEAGDHRIFEVSGYGAWDQDISEPCAAALGEAIGLDWRSFGELGPREIRARDLRNELGMVLSGLLLLASLDLGPGSPASVRDAPQILRDALDRVRPLRQEHASLAELLFTVVQAAVHRVTLTSWPGVARHGTARWMPSHRLLVADLGARQLRSGSGLDLLIHESLHREQYHDLDCALIDDLEPGEYVGDTSPHVIGWCDQDDQGVFGSAAWVSDRLFNRLNATPDSPTATQDLSWSAFGNVNLGCRNVCEIDPQGPCARVALEREQMGIVCDLSAGYFGGR